MSPFLFYSRFLKKNLMAARDGEFIVFPPGEVQNNIFNT
jgi:hypothetical protein